MLLRVAHYQLARERDEGRPLAARDLTHERRRSQQRLWNHLVQADVDYQRAAIDYGRVLERVSDTPRSPESDGDKIALERAAAERLRRHHAALHQARIQYLEGVMEGRHLGLGEPLRREMMLASGARGQLMLIPEAESAAAAREAADVWAETVVFSLGGQRRRPIAAATSELREMMAEMLASVAATTRAAEQESVRDRVIAALNDYRYAFRTVHGIAKDVGATEADVEKLLEEPNLVRWVPATDEERRPLLIAAWRPETRRERLMRWRTALTGLPN